MVFGQIVYFSVRTSSDYVIYTLDQAGLLSEYRLHLREGEENHLELQTDLIPVHEWNICRGTKWKPRKYQNRQSTNLTNNNLVKSRKTSDPQKKYLSNIETNTCSIPYTPYWSAGDLFPLRPYVEIPDEKISRDPIIQDKIYNSAKFIYIRMTEDSEEEKDILKNVLQYYNNHNDERNNEDEEKSENSDS